MRRDALYLRDIIEAAEAIQQFVADCTRETLAANDLVRSAILHKLTIIGEAAAHLSPELRAQYAEIEWADIVASRDIVVHAYFAVDWGIVWVAATQDVPALHQQAVAILAHEFPSDAPPTN